VITLQSACIAAFHAKIVPVLREYDKHEKAKNIIQLSPRVARFFLTQYTKTVKKIPTYQTITK
jgi:hypothetical protein